MTESQIQKKKIRELESQGYYVIKLSMTNKNGIPDLLALKVGETPLFIEVKTPNGKVRPIQKARMNELRKHGFTTEIFRGE